MSPLHFRPAHPGDALQVAQLHADSWRTHYRGAYADTYLDGNILPEREAVWTTRLTAEAAWPVSATTLAVQDDHLLGFVHVQFNTDPHWGSLVDNLHVRTTQHRSGIGTQLLSHAAQSVLHQAASPALYLWVLEQNTPAQHFYKARGATPSGTAPVPPPGGDPTRLTDSPKCLRMTWPDATSLIIR
ncbi:GNAT family N-acetyltransferase [Kribbella sp. NPDC051770]|uniref:GNAT family N-acetyltransferase n=1 Tax=Kribbella sp. NPDC051770 TaxID=3155413 RepID=UPI003431F42B